MAKYKSFVEAQKAFETYSKKQIPDIKVIDVLVGYTRRVYGYAGTAEFALWEGQDKGKPVRRELILDKGFAEKHGKIFENMTVGLVIYKSNTGVDYAILSSDKSKLEWRTLVPDFDYSRFKPRK